MLRGGTVPLSSNAAKALSQASSQAALWVGSRHAAMAAVPRSRRRPAEASAGIRKRLATRPRIERSRWVCAPDLKRFTTRSRRRVGWRVFSARLFEALGGRRSTPGISLFAAFLRLAPRQNASGGEVRFGDDEELSAAADPDARRRRQGETLVKVTGTGSADPIRAGETRTSRRRGRTDDRIPADRAGAEINPRTAGATTDDGAPAADPRAVLHHLRRQASGAPRYWAPWLALKRSSGAPAQVSGATSSHVAASW